MAVKVAINGLGRIGRCVARIIADRDDIELVAVNASGAENIIEYGLKYDSVHGKREDVSVKDGFVNLGSTKAKLFAKREPAKIDFASCGAEVVIECTGAYLTTEKCNAHLRDGVKKVVISAPAKDDTATFVLNINTDDYKGEAIISNASCTTNGLAPICKILDDAFGIENGLMTTIHSYTNDQNILDVKHNKDMRRARAAAINLIPTTTGAAKAMGKVMPHLSGKLNGYAIRVPTADVSAVDLTVNLKKDVTIEDINNAMRDASQNKFLGLLEIDDDKRVSSDFIGSTYSATYVPDMTSVVSGKTVKILAWYDNEWGYSSRLVDMVKFVSEN